MNGVVLCVNEKKFRGCVHNKLVSLGAGIILFVVYT